MAARKLSLLIGAEHVEPSRAENSRPSRTRNAKQLNSFLEVQELLENPEGAYWDTAVAKAFPRSETVSDGDLERSVGGLPQLVRTLP